MSDGPRARFKDSWPIWLPGQELWQTPTHWAWLGQCATNKAVAHFCNGRHVEGEGCRCACGTERPTTDAPATNGKLAVSAAKIVGLDNRNATFTPTGPAFYSVEERAAMESRIAELERQREAVLELHRPRVIEGLNGGQIVTDYCAHDDQVMPCTTAAIYGGVQ